MSIPIYSGSLKKYAREHRTHSTLSEVILWNEGLKQRKMGYQFNRQKPIKKYIVDFYSKPLNLVIELDGITHEDGVICDNKSQKDFDRQMDLEQGGLHVLRFKDEEVVSQLEIVLEKIRNWINDYEIKFPDVTQFKIRKKCSD
jgi:very-short-patch-repair endonuclease